MALYICIYPHIYTFSGILFLSVSISDVLRAVHFFPFPFLRVAVQSFPDFISFRFNVAAALSYQFTVDCRKPFYLYFQLALVFGICNLVFAMATFAARERIKVLPAVTVSALQHALGQGFQHLGHRNLPSLVPCLEGMSFKTSPLSHMTAFVQFEMVLFFLLSVCKNGLIPDQMLSKVSWLPSETWMPSEIFTLINGYSQKSYLSDSALLRISYLKELDTGVQILSLRNGSFQKS